MIRVEEKRRRIEASFMDDLLKGAGKSLLGGVVNRLEAGAKDLINWSLKRAAFTLLGLGILIAAAVLLLIAGVEALRELTVRPSVAYLLTGALGVGAGILFLRLKK